MRYLIMCRSLTYAQKAARLLERNGINVGIRRAPQELSRAGCSYSVSVRANKAIKAVEILRRENLLQGRIFEISTDGSVKEVIM